MSRSREVQLIVLVSKHASLLSDHTAHRLLDFSEDFCLHHLCNKYDEEVFMSLHQSLKYHVEFLPISELCPWQIAGKSRRISHVRRPACCGVIPFTCINFAILETDSGVSNYCICWRPSLIREPWFRLTDSEVDLQRL